MELMGGYEGLLGMKEAKIGTSCPHGSAVKLKPWVWGLGWFTSGN